MKNNLQDIVLEFNQEFHDKTGQEDLIPFIYSSTGYTDGIEFMGSIIWDSDNDIKFDITGHPLDVKKEIKKRIKLIVKDLNAFLDEK